MFHPSPAPPTFENRYTPAGRQQTLHTASQPITLEVIPTGWRTAPLIHLGPVLGETPEQLVFAFPNALLGVTPQGWMRTWNVLLSGPVSTAPAARATCAGPHLRTGAKHRGLRGDEALGGRLRAPLRPSSADAWRTGINALFARRRTPYPSLPSDRARPNRCRRCLRSRPADTPTREWVTCLMLRASHRMSPRSASRVPVLAASRRAARSSKGWWHRRRSRKL